MITNSRLNTKRPLQDLGSLSVELRRLAAEHAGLSRELSLLAQRIESGDAGSIGEYVSLGEIGGRIVGAILRGESEDLG